VPLALIVCALLFLLRTPIVLGGQMAPITQLFHGEKSKTNLTPALPYTAYSQCIYPSTRHNTVRHFTDTVYHTVKRTSITIYLQGAALKNDPTPKI